MPILDPHIFRAYDIRGIAGTQLTEEGCRAIARAFGSIVRERYAIEHPRIALGRDMRSHSPGLLEAAAEGLVETGCSVLDIGQTPSPVNYFTICAQKFDGSIQITASHNEAEYNGLKLQVREAEAFAGEDLQILFRRIEQGDFLTGEGSREAYDAITPYTEKLTELFNTLQGLKVVVDNGNGVSGPVYNAILRQCGCTLTELFSEPDGTFPNHLADPSQHETLTDLSAAVLKQKANIGIAFDGDGDRVGVVDEKGAICSADSILLLLAKDHLRRNPGAPVIFTVSNSGVLQTEILRWGGKPVMCKVGHSFVEHAMREHHASLGGEQSGHFFCAEDYYAFDDALVAALRVLTILQKSSAPLSALFAEFPQVFQTPELRPHCPDNRKGAVVESVVKHFQDEGYSVHTLDGARIDFGSGAWVGIRQSNTSPRLSVCMEARSPEKLSQVQEIVLKHLQTYPELEL